MSYPRNEPDETPDAATSDSSAVRLKSFIERIERLEEEKAAIAADIKEVYAEAKGTGFDAKIMREIVRIRKMDAADRAERQELLDLYMSALGMLVGTPLGEAAMDSARGTRRSTAEPKPDAPKEPAAPREPTAEEIAASKAIEAKAALARMTTDEAHALGKSDHSAGKKITANPFAAKSKQRASWDKGWCEADGSDGMALPGAGAQ